MPAGTISSSLVCEQVLTKVEQCEGGERLQQNAPSAIGDCGVREGPAEQLRDDAGDPPHAGVNAYNRSLIEASFDPLISISPDGRVMDVNRAAENSNYSTAKATRNR